MRIFHFALSLAILAVALTACGAGTLLSDVAVSAPALRPTGAGEHVDVSYRIGQPAKVSIYLQDAAGTRYTLRDAEPRNPSSEPYQLRLDGTAPTNDPVLKQRALPSGDYTLVPGSTLSLGDIIVPYGTDWLEGYEEKMAEIKGYRPKLTAAE